MKMTSRRSNNPILWNISVIFIVKLYACFMLWLVKALSGKYARHIFSKQIFPDISSSGWRFFFDICYLSQCVVFIQVIILFSGSEIHAVTFSSLTIIFNPKSNGRVQVLIFSLGNYTLWNITLKPMCIIVCRP